MVSSKELINFYRKMHIFVTQTLLKELAYLRYLMDTVDLSALSSARSISKVN